MKTLIRFSTVKMRFLFHPFTARKSLYVWHKLIYPEPLILTIFLHPGISRNKGQLVQSHPPLCSQLPLSLTES